MTVELYDDAVFNGTINNGASETLTVDAHKAEHLEILVDDTTGSSPGSYDLTLEFYSTAADAFMQRDSVTGSTARSPSVTKSARGQQVRITLTNQSGAGADYRISLETFKEI